MDSTSKKFLFDLLKTHSPSGSESEIQKVWASYVKKFANIKSDTAGNIIGSLNEKAPFSVMLAGHCDEIGFMVRDIDDKGFVSVESSGFINPRLLPGLKAEIKGYSGKTVKGVFGFNLKDRVGNRAPEVEDYFIDCGISDAKELKKLIRVGDYGVYTSEPEIIGDGRLICKGLDNKTGAFIIAETLKRLSKKKLKVAVYGVSTTGEETNQRGAYTAAADLKPSMGIACDVTFNNDLPSEGSTRTKVYFRKGPAISVGSPINKKVNELIEKTAKRIKMPIQFELCPDRTHTDADKIMFSGAGIPVALLSLPLRYMHSPIEEADMKDIEDEIVLLTEMISSLTGKEDLRPTII